MPKPHRILMILTSSDTMGAGGEPTGLWFEELATPYYAFVDAGAAVTMGSIAGGPAPIDPRSAKPKGENETSVECFLADTSGAASFTAMLTVFTVAMIESPAIGWTSPAMLALVVAFVVLLAAFAVIELRTARPMLDVSLFRYRRFVGVQLLPVATCACFVVLLVLMPLRFIGIEGRSEIEAGVLMLALSAPMLVVPIVAATLARRISPGVLSGIGLSVAAAGLAWLGTMEVGAGHSVIAPMLLIGIGSGLPWGLMDGLSVSVVPKERARA